jgi:hypothetical protein
MLVKERIHQRTEMYVSYYRCNPLKKGVPEVHHPLFG